MLSLRPGLHAVHGDRSPLWIQPDFGAVLWGIESQVEEKPGLPEVVVGRLSETFCLLERMTRLDRSCLEPGFDLPCLVAFIQGEVRLQADFVCCAKGRRRAVGFPTEYHRESGTLPGDLTCDNVESHSAGVNITPAQCERLRSGGDAWPGLLPSRRR